MGAAGSTGNLRWMALTVSCVAATIAAPLVWMSLADDDHETQLPHRELRPHLSMSTSTTTTVPFPTTTAVAADLIAVEELPGPYARVIAGDHGILLATADGSLPFRRLTWEPTYLAFGIGEGRVVHQGYGHETTGPIVVSDALAEHEIFGSGTSGPDYSNLQDAGFVGGRPYALVSTYTSEGEQDLEVRLVLVDLETYRQLDLGSVGGWEEYVEGARMLPGGDVAVLRGHHGGHTLERRRVDGTIAWSVPVDGEEDRTLTVHRVGDGRDDLELLVLEPTSYRSPDHPSLGIRHVDPASGTEMARVERRLDLPDGDDVPHAICADYAEAIRGSLLCDAVRSIPLRIDLATGRATRETGAPPEGTMTFWRFEE